MIEALKKKRAAVLAEHKAAAKYHPFWAEVAKKGGHCISQRPIAFLVDDEVIILDECVKKIVDRLAEFIALVDSKLMKAVSPDGNLVDVNMYEHIAKTQPTINKAISFARKIVAANPTDELRVAQRDWNSVIFAMEEVGRDEKTGDPTFHVVITDATPLPE